MFTKEVFDLTKLSPTELLAKLKELKITLTADEALKVQNEILKRPPSLAELTLWSIQGSEHSSYKSSRNHLKQFSTDAPNVILGPKEDAGIVEVAKDNEGHKYGVVISHESHNHPSQVVPFEGAATGVGGNVRDVSCMGAKVIATADPLRFGALDAKKTRWIADGVVSGIAGYGNPIGIPNIGGDLYFDESYNENCLVNVVTLGVLREDEIIHSRAPAPKGASSQAERESAEGYDLILVGKPTDNSGFGGASFASLELKEHEHEQNKGAVQEPNAFLKRHLLKAMYTLFHILQEKKLMDKVGLKDLGAGGISCAGVELADASGYGSEINLDLVPVGVANLHPAVILCSETQERYMWVSAPEVTPLILKHYNETFKLPKIAEGARAAVVGKIRADKDFVVTYKGEEIVHAKAEDVTSGLLYNRPFTEPKRHFKEPDLPEPKDYSEVLLKILSHENVASREPIFERYDKNVQGITVIEPGEADAGVMQPFKDHKYPAEIRQTGVALGIGQTPRYSKISPYWGGVAAVAEAMRNVAAVGGIPYALTDCLNYGNPEKPEQMWEFVEGTRGVAEAAKGLHLKDYPAFPVPIISGNVSLYNEAKGKAIAPSPIISCVGRLADVTKVITMSFKKTDSTLFLIGERKDECGGSVYYDVVGAIHESPLLGANVPKPNLKEAESQIFALTDAIEERLVLAAHDISDGGLAVTLAEMSFINEIGFEVSIPGELRTDKKLFSETGGFVIEVGAENLQTVKEIFTSRGVELIRIGKTTETKHFKFNDVINIKLHEAKEAWTNGLRNKL